MVSMTLGELAIHVQGKLCGPDDLSIHDAKILRDAGPGDITLADRPRMAQLAEHCGASAVVTNGNIDPPKIPHIAVPDVAAAFARIVELYHPLSEQRMSGISVHAHISPTAKVGNGTTVGAGVTIGDHVVIGEHCVIHPGAHIMQGVRIGDRATIFPRVVLYEDTIVGDNVILHAGAVLGAYGFGYKMVEGRHELSAQLGNVEVHDDVEIGANTTVDRGTYGPTVIGAGTKLDNLVMIGHNCRIGRHNLLCSQVGVAGSTTTGDYVVMAGQVGVRDHVTIGNTAQIGAQAGVANDLEAGAQVVGSPARPEKLALQEVVAVSKLPDLRKRLRALERQQRELLAELEAGANATKDDAPAANAQSDAA